MLVKHARLFLFFFVVKLGCISSVTWTCVLCANDSSAVELAKHMHNSLASLAAGPNLPHSTASQFDQLLILRLYVSLPYLGLELDALCLAKFVSLKYMKRRSRTKKLLNTLSPYLPLNQFLFMHSAVDQGWVGY